MFLRHIVGDPFSVGQVVIDADEGRGDIGLFVQVRIAKPVDEEGGVENSGVVFGSEASPVSVAGLRAGTVDTIDTGWDRGGSGVAIGGGATERCGAE